MRKAVFIIRLRVTTKDETFEKGMVYTKMNRGEVLSHRLFDIKPTNGSKNLG
jgi:hypothetical protein